MPRSNWRIVLAAVGWLALCGQAPQKAADTKQQQPAERIADSLGAIAAASVKPVESSEYESPCGQEKDNRNSDLCAQWKAADAAQRAERWAWWQLWLSAGGLCGLLYSLHLTRNAMKDADAALAIAGRNADAAAELVRVSQRTASAQLRAYLDFDGVGLLRDESQDRDDAVMSGVSIQIKNFGHTPATNVSIVTGLHLVMAGNSQRHRLIDDMVREIGAIAPTDHVTARSMFHIPFHVWDSITNRSVALQVDTTVDYTDAFEVRHALKSTHESDGQNPFGFVLGTRHAD